MLHLVADWRATVDEALRVLRPRGALLVDIGGETPAPWSEWSRAVFREHGVVRVRPGVTSARDVIDHLGGRADSRRLTPLTVRVRRTLRQDLDQWGHQVHSWTWPYPQDQMRAACSRIRTRAAQEGWPLDREVLLTPTIKWWAFEPRP